MEILSIMIQSCTLPKEIEQQMEEKTKVISKNAQQRMFHQNNMQNTRMEEEIVTLMQTFEEQRQQEESAGAEQINEEKVKLNDAIAEAKKAEAAIREEAIAKIQKLRAESNLEVQRIVSRKVRMFVAYRCTNERRLEDSHTESAFASYFKDETTATMKAESEKEAANLQAVTKLEVERKLAEASLTAEKNRAEARRVLARAEGVIAPYLSKKNEHVTSLKQIDVYKNLAGNDNLILCDTDDSDTNVVVVADAILSNQKHVSRSSVIAEMSLLNNASNGLFGKTSQSATSLSA